MKYIIQILIITLITSLPAFSVEIPGNLKKYLIKTYPKIEFRIDRSFKVNEEIFLPLIPILEEKTDKVETVLSIPDKEGLPKLLWFSNNWAYAKLLSYEKNVKTIIGLNEIPEKYKGKFIKMRFPSDLVVPKDLVLNNDLSELIGELPIKTKKSKTDTKNNDKKTILLQDGKSLLDLKGNLYLTSPNSGKIVILHLKNIPEINYIDTMGIPWEIAYNNINSIIYITDFTNNQIYELTQDKNEISKTIILSSIAKPKDIKVSKDGLIIYFLEELGEYLTAHTINQEKIFVKRKLITNSSNFSILEDLNTIAVTNTTANSLTFLNTANLQIEGLLTLDGGPEKIIASKERGKFYIACRNINKVVEVDPLTKKVTNTIESEELPVSLILNPPQNYLYIGNGKSNSISVINLENGTLEKNIKLSPESSFPSNLAISNDGKWLITTSDGTNKISIIDLTNNEVTTIDTGVTTHSVLLIEDAKIQ